MRYTVRASGAPGIVTVAVEAADEAAACRQVTERALRPLSVKSRGLSWSPRDVFPLTLFSQELLALLEAGLALTEALEALCDKEARPEVRAVIERLLGRLREGQRFSDALAEQPIHFPALYVGLMRAAERTSNLPASLVRYVEYRNRLDTVRRRVVSALIYPAILAVVGLAVMAFLLGHVVPRFASVYQGMGRELPWLSAQLIAWGSFVTRHGQALTVALLALAIPAFLAGRAWWRRDGPRRLLARLPGVATTLATYELVRLYLALGALLAGGLPILHALRLAEGLLTPTTLSRYRAATEAISRGENLSQSFAAAGLTTPVALRLLRVGERAGRLADMLERAARFHDGEIARRVDLFARTFEPLLMAAIGLVIGTIVVLLYLPIFDLAGSLQ